MLEIMSNGILCKERLLEKLLRSQRVRWIKGHHVDASKENPEYLVKSDKTGAQAAHKSEALTLVSEESKGKESSQEEPSKKSTKSSSPSKKTTTRERKTKRKSDEKSKEQKESKEEKGAELDTEKASPAKGSDVEDSVSMHTRSADDKEKGVDEGADSEKHTKKKSKKDLDDSPSKKEKEQKGADEEKEQKGADEEEEQKKAENDEKKVEKEHSDSTEAKNTDNDDNASMVKEWRSLMNMNVDELEDWLKTEDSKEVGWKAEGHTESVGHDSGRKIIKLLPKGDDEFTDEDIQHIRKVRSYCKRHLAQKPHHDIEHTRWRYSLMNWGHDPTKD